MTASEIDVNKLIKELRTLGRGNSPYGYFMHTSGRTHMAAVATFFNHAVSLARQAADALEATQSSASAPEAE